jgi:hypothetical protein
VPAGTTRLLVAEPLKERNNCKNIQGKILATNVRILQRNKGLSYKDLDYSLEKNKIKKHANEHHMHLQQIWTDSRSNQQSKQS